MSQQLELGNGSLEMRLGQVADEFTDHVHGEQPDVEDYVPGVIQTWPRSCGRCFQALQVLEPLFLPGWSPAWAAGQLSLARCWFPAAWAISADLRGGSGRYGHRLRGGAGLTGPAGGR